MCVQCVANSVPYVGLAAGGLRLMAWRARATRARPQEGSADAAGSGSSLSADRPAAGIGQG